MERLNEAIELATRAVSFDQSKCIDAAAYYYKEAARVITDAGQSVNQQGFEHWLNKAKEYSDRAEHLLISKAAASFEQHKPEVIHLRKCKFLFLHALDADEAGEKDVALELYTKAIEMCLQTKNETSDKDQRSKLTSLATQALERAEKLKGATCDNESEYNEERDKVIQHVQPIHVPTLSRQVSVSSSDRQKLRRGWSSHLIVCGDPSLSDDEKKILLATSRINGINYVPFMDRDLAEKFQYAIPFSDNDGQLALSSKQRKEFSHWARPDEICREPKMILNESTDCYSIKQTVVTDCSFVASLAVSALFEKKFNQSLISHIIYPKNKQKKPIYNPFGKYMVKLHLNGVSRKVIIDDTLPVGRHGELLCSFSTNKNELWISLLEKAYMKVMGGYDFPGSNSNIDLHVLTGWIPERIAIKPQDETFNSEDWFNKLFLALNKGEVLVTVATGNIPEYEADRSGLVPTHAYAILDIRHIHNIKLFKLKNPWSHVRWKGNYSELDKVHWTPDLQSALNYDPKSAEMFDNGVFWIDYPSILKFFDVFYLNWNPKLFSYTSCIHQSWSAGVGPARDNYNFSDNPQFSLVIDPPPEQGPSERSVWILLTRHITTIEDFKNNSEYITVVIYKANGRKVYYPMDPAPYIEGIRINSPHYLAKIELNSSDITLKRFTLVISQYEKTTTIYYTLRVYSTCPFKLNKIIDPYVFSFEVNNGRWDTETAGGCQNHPNTYQKNPKYQIVLDKQSHMRIDLKGPKQYNIGLEVTSTNLSNFKPISSAPYRSGFVVLDLPNLPAATYHIVPSTFLPGQESPFFLTFKSSNKINVTRIN